MLLLNLLLIQSSYGQSPQTGTTILNEAVATFTNSEGVPYPPLSATAITEVGGGPVLALSNTASPSVIANGEQLTYSLVQQNLGNTVATGVVLTSQLSEDVEFISATGGGVYDSSTRTVTWQTASLPPAGINSFFIETRVAVAGDVQIQAAEAITSRAVTTSLEQARDEATAIALVGASADLKIVKTVDRTQVRSGGNLSYQITVNNSGNRTALEARINDALPDGVALLADSVNLPFELIGRNLRIELGDIATATSIVAEFSVVVSPVAEHGQQLDNRAVVASTGTDFVLSNTVTTTVVEGLELEFSGSSMPDAVRPGQEINYTLSVGNIGAEIRGPLFIRQPLPADTTLASIGDGGEFSNSEALWRIDSLAPGEHAEVHWAVLTNQNIQVNRVLRAAAFVDSETAVEAETEITTLILDLPATGVDFYNENFEKEATAYFEGDDAAFLQIDDLGANKDSDQIDSVTATISNFVATDSTSTIAALHRGDVEELTLFETSPDSGVFQGQIPLDLTDQSPSNGTIYVESNTKLTATYVDSQARTLAVNTSDAVYHPSSAVFNSITGETVPRAAIQVILEDGSSPRFVDGSDNIFITNQKGEVFFPALDLVPGQRINLKIELSPPPESELRFPSEIIDENLPKELSTGKVTQFGRGSRGEIFSLDSANNFINFDMPIDPPEGNLRVEKTASASQLAIGEIISYQVSIANAGSTPIIGTTLLDEPPREFRYISGSASNTEGAIATPIVESGLLSWRIGILPPGESIEISYQMMVGVDSQAGRYINTAYATGNNLFENVESNIASHQVNVSEGIFSRNGTIIGRVFVDLNDNGLIDQNEPGVAQALVLMEDGSYVLTDGAGRYSLRNIRPGQHVLRLDDSSIPLTVKASGRGGAFLNRADSQWVEMNASGLIKGNFPVVPVSATARDEILSSNNAANRAAEIPEPSDNEPKGDQVLSAPEVRAAELQELLDSLESNELSVINLADQQQMSGVHADVRIKYPSGGMIKLRLNDREVSEDSIGAVVHNPAIDASLVEYVAVRLQEGGENILNVQFLDPFGNERAREEIRLYPLSPLAAIAIEIATGANPIADGQTLIPVIATLTNTRGNAASQITMLSVDVRPARIVEEDADPSNPGHQIPVSDGVAQFTVRAPRQPGVSEIRVQADAIREQADISFLPHLRGLMVVGSGDVTLSSGSTDGNMEQLDNIFGDKVEDGSSVDGHLGVFVNGAITEKTLLTATYDSAKIRPDDFFFAREQQIDEESIPAITGDGSEVGYSGSSRDKLFLRLDREESHVVWGDYRTTIGDDQLSFYNRTFTGFRTEIREEKFRVTGFAAEMLQDQIVDAIPANGTSGYYYLTRGPLILGSERVVVETRDRLRPDVVLNSASLSRNVDYDIDYYEGSVLMRSPIPTYDEALNPNVIIVTYEVENETNDQWAYGVRAEADLFKNFTLGATAVVEESVIDDYGLQGADISYLAAGINTLFTAEYAQTQSIISEDGLLSSEDGSAIHLAFDGSATEQLKFSGYYRDIDEFFVNASSIDTRRGTTNYGVTGSYQLNESNALLVTAFEENDELLDNDFSHIGAGWQGQINRFQLGAEVYSDQFDSDKIAPTALADGGHSENEAFDSASGRYPFDSTAEQVSQDLGLRLSGSLNLSERFALTLSHSQDLKNTDQSLSYAKLNYALSADRTLYFIQRFDRYVDREESRSLFGFETPIAYNTTSFVEYQMEDTVNGTQIRQSIGLRNQFELAENLFGNATYENLDTVSGDVAANRPDGFASTLSTTYLPSDAWRITGRGELRDETNLSSKLGELGVASKLTEDLSLLGRARYFETEGEESGSREDLRVSLGMAWRPVDNDKFQGLARLDWWAQDRQTQLQSFNEDKLYGSVEGIYQINDKLTLSAKYAGKQYELDSYSLYNDLYSLRASYLINDNWQLGATMRVLNEHDFDNTLSGGAVDVGRRLWEFVWVTAGYSFDDFDSDLTGAGYSGEGFFLKFRFKFDENILSDF